MATVHLTLSDTPAGGVSVHTDFKPAIGSPCSPAQGHALEIIARTHKQWGLEPPTAQDESDIALLQSIKRQHPQWSWQQCAEKADAMRQS